MILVIFEKLRTPWKTLVIKKYFSFCNWCSISNWSNNENEFSRFQLWLQLCSFTLLMDTFINCCWSVFLAHHWRSLRRVLKLKNLKNTSQVVNYYFTFHLTAPSLKNLAHNFLLKNYQFNVPYLWFNTAVEINFVKIVSNAQYWLKTNGIRVKGKLSWKDLGFGKFWILKSEVGWVSV